MKFVDYSDYTVTVTTDLVNQMFAPILPADFLVRPLQTEDAHTLSLLLRSQTSEYAHFFKPFDFNEGLLTQMLLSRKRDVFTGMFWQGKLIGFFMLRGWDEGFEVPAYGALIDEAHSGHGLGTLSLRMAKSICKLSRSPRIMLKVNRANTRARSLFERLGFVQTGFDRNHEVLIFHFVLDGP